MSEEVNAPDPAADSVRQTVERVLAERRHLDGPLLPVLHGVQEALGYVPLTVLAQIGAGLNLSRAEVYGVVTYYHHFRTVPAGRIAVQVCRAESCRSMGAERLLAHARAKTGCSETHGTSGDGVYSVQAAYCLGLCAMSPAVMVGDRVHARVTTARLDNLLEAHA